jgi:hypothetical protein
MIYALVLYSGPKYCLEHERARFLSTRFDTTDLGLRVGVFVARTRGLRRRRPRSCRRWRSHHGTVSAPDRRLGWGRCGNPTGRTTRSSLIAGFHAALALEYKISPGLKCTIARASALPNGFRHDSKPALLICGAIRIEVNHFTIAKADAESFLNKHVAIFFLGKCRFAAGTALCAGLLLK